MIYLIKYIPDLVSLLRFIIQTPRYILLYRYIRFANKRKEKKRKEIVYKHRM